jgi:prepilin-type N-terminal cleavage/methylation domain-containing protein
VGFTLIELMISITLVAALATGMLMAMRTSLLSFEKINGRLQFNRRVMGMERILTRQIGGVMPVMSDCGTGRVPFFLGTSESLRLVSSYSMSEGARGYPQFDEFRVVKGEQGLRLVVTEHPYTGPSSTAPFCGGVEITPASLIVADRCASVGKVAARMGPAGSAGGGKDRNDAARREPGCVAGDECDGSDPDHATSEVSIWRFPIDGAARC